MRNDARNCIIVRKLTPVRLAHHHQESPTYAQALNESKPRLQYLLAPDRLSRVPLQPHHAQEYQRLQVAGRQAQVVVMMTIRKIVRTIARVTQNAHQAVEEDSIRIVFDVFMQTHSVSHGLFADFFC